MFQPPPQASQTGIGEVNLQAVELGEPMEHSLRQRLEVVLIHVTAELSKNETCKARGNK